MYAVKEIYHTLQGEGAHTGRAAVFCRFTGCNLWSGREQDRATAACRFCDTDFIGTDGPGGGKFVDAPALAAAVLACWDRATQDQAPGRAVPPCSATGSRRTKHQTYGVVGAGEEGRLTSAAQTSDRHHPAPTTPYVVFTGGEPLLQLDAPLIDACRALGIQIAIESNGTREAPPGIDWICVSPKPRSVLKQLHGHELKLVYPQPEIPPASVAHLDFQHFYLQPMDGPDRAANTAAAIRYCLQHPQWRLSLQTHKLTGIP